MVRRQVNVKTWESWKKICKVIFFVVVSFSAASRSSFCATSEIFHSICVIFIFRSLYLSRCFLLWFSDDNAISINYCFFRCVFILKNGAKKKRQQQKKNFGIVVAWDWWSCVSVRREKRLLCCFFLLVWRNKQLESGMAIHLLPRFMIFPFRNIQTSFFVRMKSGRKK